MNPKTKQKITSKKEQDYFINLGIEEGKRETKVEFAKERQRFEDECDDLRRQLEMKDFEFVKMLENADFGSYITSREGVVFDVSGFIEEEIKLKLQEKKK